MIFSFKKLFLFLEQNHLVTAVPQQNLYFKKKIKKSIFSFLMIAVYLFSVLDNDEIHMLC